jgi:hypothetical protein
MHELVTTTYKLEFSSDETKVVLKQTLEGDILMLINGKTVGAPNMDDLQALSDMCIAAKNLIEEG